jgi:hypothetical protein
LECPDFQRLWLQKQNRMFHCLAYKKVPNSAIELQRYILHIIIMKKKSLFRALPIAAIFAVTSCKKPAETTTAPAATAEVVTTPDAEPVVEIKVDPLARSAKLGFAQMLPADTETLMLFQNGKELAKSFRSSKFWEIITEAQPDIEDMIDGDGDTLTPGDILGDEFFLATGKNTALQTGNLIKASERYTYHSVKAAISIALAQTTSDADSEELKQGAESMVKDLVNDPEFGAAWLERSEMPPIYFGCKTNSNSAERVQAAFAQVAAAAAGAGPFAEETVFEVNGHSFKGTKISGKLLVDGLEKEMIDGMKQSMGASAVDGILDAAAKKNIIIASGSVNGYELILIGSRPEDFAFAATPAESLASANELAYADAYLEKKQVALLFSRKNLQDIGMQASNSAAYCDALRDALASNDTIDTREIEALLQLIPQREKDMLSMDKTSNFGAVVVLDQGLRIETYGGTALPSLDTTAPNQLGALGQGKDVAIFANWTSNQAYDDAVRAYVETLFQTGYACAKSAASLKLEEENFAQFKQYFSIFDSKFAGHASKIWTAMSTKMAEGLGQETAFLVTLDGEMPPIPGVPQKVVKQGVFPRISSISAVKDRAKLAASWDTINESGEGIMKEISEMMGAEQAMPKPMSSQANDLVTWFFAAPLFTDDFSPSVTVSDKWFVTSTSKKHAVELAKSADSSNSGKTGAYISVDFDAFSAFGKKWFDVMKDNKEDMLALNEEMASEFESNKEDVSKGLDATADMDQLEIHVRREGAVSRTTIHFKTH